MLISYIHKAYFTYYREKHKTSRSEFLLCYRCPRSSPFSIAAGTAALMLEVRAWAAVEEGVGMAAAGGGREGGGGGRRW